MGTSHSSARADTPHPGRSAPPNRSDTWSGPRRKRTPHRPAVTRMPRANSDACGRSRWVCRPLPRATYATPGIEATMSATAIGCPCSAADRPSRAVFDRWPTVVAAVICPPVSPKTPLSSIKQVIDSPRAAACSTSARPSDTMSPSPCRVYTAWPGSIRLTPVATAGARPWRHCRNSTSAVLMICV